MQTVPGRFSMGQAADLPAGTCESSLSPKQVGRASESFVVHVSVLEKKVTEPLGRSGSHFLPQRSPRGSGEQLQLAADHWAGCVGESVPLTVIYRHK